MPTPDHVPIHHHYDIFRFILPEIPAGKVWVLGMKTHVHETSVREQLIMKRLTFTRVFAILTVLHLPYAIQASSFTIDYEKNTFLKDGEAFR